MDDTLNHHTVIRELVVPDLLGYTATGSSVSEEEGPPFDLQAHPSQSPPQLHELLPSGSNVPVPLEPTPRRNHRRSCRSLHVDHEAMPREAVHSVYAPGGEVGDLHVHAAAELTLIAEDYRTPEAVDALHRSAVQARDDVTSPEEVFTDPVTTNLERTTAHGKDRTEHWRRNPNATRNGISRDVRRPVSEVAHIVQSTDWGLISTSAFLTPRPEKRRTLTIARDIADHIARQATKYDTPVFQWEIDWEFANSSKTGRDENSTEQREGRR
jgi:hypothetical protein